MEAGDLSEFGKQDVRGLIDRIVKRGAPISANRTLASLKAWLNRCIEQDILTVSPAAAIRPPAPEKARERVRDRYVY
jgi:site-specific recombinase XerC